MVLVVHPKYESLLETALRSLRSQSASQYEIIIQDNPTDTLAKACNLAISRSTGRYIVRLDADDFIDPRLIELEARHLEEHPQIDCVWCDYWKTYPEQGEGFEVHHLEYCPQTDLEHACGAMFRKEVWEQLGGYDESLKYQEAFDFWLRFNKAGFKAEHISEPLYYYRQHTGSMSTNIGPKNQTRIEILEKHDIHHR